MSKIAIAGATTGTGTFTLASPATNTDRVLTLPDEAGTIDTLQRAGNVLQVVSTTKSDTFSSTSTSWLDITGLSLSITPTSTSSKIMLFVSLHGGGQTQTPRFKVLRDSTDVGVGIAAGNRDRAGMGTGYAVDSNQIQSMSWNYLDSPNTTSAIVYKIQGRNDNGQTWQINRSASYGDALVGVTTITTITAMEIAG